MSKVVEKNKPTSISETERLSISVLSVFGNDVVFRIAYVVAMFSMTAV